MGSDYAFSTPAALTYAQAAAMPAQWSSVPGYPASTTRRAPR